jgi:homospermidine synthase
MSNDKKYLIFKNRILMLGFGSIGQGVLPLLLRHLDIKPSQITIITAEDAGHEEAKEYGVELIVERVTPQNYKSVLGVRLSKGDFLVNLAVDASAVDLIELAQSKGVHYLDTCVEPWAEECNNPDLTSAERSIYHIRHEVLELRSRYPNGPTAVITHGANPGLVSHFLKQALVDVARAGNPKAPIPQSRKEWAELARDLNIKVIHVSERDTQISKIPKQPGEFVNTWSIDGLYGEGIQPAELGWGTHEKEMPPDAGQHSFGTKSAIFLDRPGYCTRVRSWTPLEGAYQGYLIAHAEAISIPDYFTIAANGKPAYRPTCHYAYYPCNDAVLSLYELEGRNGVLQIQKRIMKDEVLSGIDELGVLLMGNEKGVYWYGSRLSIEEARKLAPYNNATTLQVTSSVLAAIIWAIENPNSGIVEADEMDFQRIMEIAGPYLGEMIGVWGDWSPLENRNGLFPEDIDTSDPWQFKNMRVA